MLRPKTPAPGVPIEFAEPEPGTGVVEGDDLARVRASRPTPVRFRKLEEKADEHGERLGKVEQTVADINGQMKIFPRLVDTMEASIKALQNREHVTLTAQVEIDKARQLDAIDAGKDNRKDTMSARKTRRWLVAKVVAGVVAVASSGAFLHWLFSRGGH